jgi:NtrC-family two-component system sensor histidine kinase KinB
MNGRSDRRSRKTSLRQSLSILLAMALAAFLIREILRAPLDRLLIPPILIFTLLIYLSARLGVPLAGGWVSILPMAWFAALLILGRLPAALAAYAGSWLNALARWRFPPGDDGEAPPAGWEGLSVASANSWIQTLAVWAAGSLLLALGRQIPLSNLTPDSFKGLVVGGIILLAVNYALAGIYLGGRSLRALAEYGRQIPRLIFLEGLPLLLAPILALTYTRIGVSAFLVLATTLVVAALITRNLTRASRRLQRQVQQLDSLQAIGRTLSQSLELETILAAIHQGVARLMPADNFFVALYDAGTDEVSFPLSFDDGERSYYRPRRAGSGLTEYVLHSKQALLATAAEIQNLSGEAVKEVGRPAQCWLGVPMIAGEGPLGVIVVQSYQTTDRYEECDREVLQTIASQAAVAIQNARMYALTDRALAQRLKQLELILQNSREGIVLFDPEWHILAANRAAASFSHIPVADLEHPGAAELAAQAQWRHALGLEILPRRLADDSGASQDSWTQKPIVLPGSPDRPLEQTVAAVRGGDGKVAGWLLVLRDLSEEQAIDRQRDELTHMLIHDLRSPLMVISGSIDMIEASLQEGRDDWRDLAGLARKSIDRLMRLIENLLDINRLESGEMPLKTALLGVRPLLEDVVWQLSPLATAAHLTITREVDPDLPLILADPAHMARVISNLLDNAIKFTPQGGRIRVWARRALAPHPEGLLIGINDSGPGVADELKPHLFAKFQQAEDPSHPQAGTGLGLPYCRLAIEAQGGRIWLEKPSSGYPGAHFVVWLPVAKSAVASQ